MMKRGAAAAMAALFLVVGTPVAAGTSGRHDPNDTAGPLDIKRISHGHTSDGRLWHKVVMYGRWGPKDLRGEDEIRFYFSNDGEDRYDEVHVSVALKNGRLGAWIFPYTEGSDYAAVGPSERIRFVRPDRSSVKIFFERSWMKNRTGRYTWSLGTNYKNKASSNCSRGCFDYAPGRNPDRLVHNI